MWEQFLDHVELCAKGRRSIKVWHPPLANSYENKPVRPLILRQKVARPVPRTHRREHARNRSPHVRPNQVGGHLRPRQRLHALQSGRPTARHRPTRPTSSPHRTRDPPRSAVTPAQRSGRNAPQPGFPPPPHHNRINNLAPRLGSFRNSPKPSPSRGLWCWLSTRGRLSIGASPDGLCFPAPHDACRSRLPQMRQPHRCNSRIWDRDSAAKSPTVP